MLYYISKKPIYFFLAGYDEGRKLDSKDFLRETSPRKIRSRKWVIGTQTGKTKKAVQIYQVTGSDEWFALSDLGFRL